MLISKSLQYGTIGAGCRLCLSWTPLIIQVQGRGGIAASTPDFTSEWCCGSGILADFCCRARPVSTASSERQCADRCGGLLPLLRDQEGRVRCGTGPPGARWGVQPHRGGLESHASRTRPTWRSGLRKRRRSRTSSRPRRPPSAGRCRDADGEVVGPRVVPAAAADHTLRVRRVGRERGLTGGEDLPRGP